MAARFKAGRGRAAPSGAFGVPWSDPRHGAAGGTFSRGPVSAAPPPAAPPAAMPVDPIYDASVGSAQRNLATTLAGLQHQRGQLGQSYGLGIDPAGNVFDDVSNPYSRAATLKKMYDEAQRGTNTTMAARGQLYAGSLQNAQNANAEANLRSRDQMIRQFMADQQGISQRELAARNAALDAVSAAGSDRIMRALASRPDPLSVPGVAAPTLPPAAPARPLPALKHKPAPKKKKR